MSDTTNPQGEKFHNLHLTRGQNFSAHQGTFKAIVRLARAEYRPPYMRILGQFSPGYLRAEIDYAAFPRVHDDSEVLAVELLAYRSQPSGAV